MHLSRQTRAALVAVVVLAGAPVIVPSPAAQARAAGGCTIVGTAGNDVLTGTAADDVVCGLGGDDRITGRGGDDVLRGGGGADLVRGGPGDDRVAGGGGRDRLLGQGGDDVLRGDGGNDDVVGGRGDDRLVGSRGADRIVADGDPVGSVDDVRCGPGKDKVSADPVDRVRPDCEGVEQDDPPTDANDAPVANDDSRTVAEDASATAFATLLGNDSDAESDPFAITGASDPAHGSTTFSAADVTYTPDADHCGSDSFTYSVTGGDTATVSITVTCANDAPVVDLDTANPGNGATAAFTETDPHTGTGVLLAQATGISDVDDTNLESATLTLMNRPDGDADESLSFTAPPGSGISGSYAAATGVLQLTGSGSRADYAAAISSVRYDNTANPPDVTNRTVTVVVNDGDTGSTPQTATVTVAPFSAPPVNTVPGAQTVDEDTTLTFTGGRAISVADADSANLSVEVTVTDGTFTLSGSAGLTVTGNGTATVTLAGPSANLNAALDGSQYKPTANDSGPATLTIATSDGTVGDSDTVNISVTPVNDAPVADDESFSGSSRAVGNTSLVVDDPTDAAPDPTGAQKTVTGDLLDGDSDVDTPATGFTLTPATDQATTGGGRVTIQADGDFTYLPEQGCADTSDTFTYTLNDNDALGNKTDSGTVTVAIADCVWFVDDDASAPAPAVAGTSQAPYPNLDELDGAGGAGDEDAAGDRVFVYSGSYTAASGFPLEASQQLLTQRHGLALPDGGVGSTTLVAAGGTTSTFSGGVVASTNNTLQGVTFGANAAGPSLSGSSVGTLTVNTVTSGALVNAVGGAVSIAGAGNVLDIALAGVTTGGGTNAISLANASGTFTAGSGSLSNASGATVVLTGGSLGFTLAASLDDDAGQLVSISGQTGGTKDFNGAVSDSPFDGDGGGVSLTGNTGATVRFDGGLNLSTGGGAALTATGGGTVVVTGAANTLTTTTGAALTVSNTGIGANGLTFRSISANGAPKAIVLGSTGAAGGLTVTGTGTTAGTGGTIQNSSTRGAELIGTTGASLSNMSFVNANSSVDGGGAGACDDLTITACNAAIYLNGVNGITLDRVNLSGTMVENGITGVGVSGLTMSNSSITGAGDQAHESGMELQNLSGTSTISNTDIAFSETNSVDIVNTDVTSTLTFDNVTLRDTQTVSSGGATNGNGEGGLQLRSFSSAAGQPTTNLDIVNSDLLRLRTQAVQVIGEDDSVINVDVTGNTIDSQSDIGAGIDLNGNDTSQVRFNVLNNPTIHSRGGAGVNVTSFVDASTMGRINGNTMTVDSIGSGIRVLPQESSTGVVEARNNSVTMSAGNNSTPIDAQARFADARLDLTLDGNTTDTDVMALADVNVTAGSSLAGETNVVCLDLKNHTAVPPLPSTNRTLRLRVSDLSNTIRMYLEGFVTDAEGTWDARSNTPSGAGQQVNQSLTGSAVAPAAPPGGLCAEPTNPMP